MTAVSDDLVRNNNTVNWIPESSEKDVSVTGWKNIQDWGISSNRYWGTPLNVWECECGHQEVYRKPCRVSRKEWKPGC